MANTLGLHPSEFGNNPRTFWRGQVDGWADFVAPSFEAFLGLFADPSYLEKIKPVEEQMLDMSATLVVHAGFEGVFMDDEKATESVK